MSRIRGPKVSEKVRVSPLPASRCASFGSQRMSQSFLTSSLNSTGIISSNRRGRGRFDRMLVNFYKTANVFLHCCLYWCLKLRQLHSIVLSALVFQHPAAAIDNVLDVFVFQRRVKPSDMVLLTLWTSKRNRRKEP